LEEPEDKNPFSGIETIEELNKIFDEMELELKNSSRSRDEYDEGRNKLYSFHHEQHRRIRNKEQKRPIGFLQKY
jgi:hypothetical protein